MSLDALRKRVEVTRALAAGAVLSPVPYNPPGTAVARINVTMERGLLPAIDTTAKGRGMACSAFLAPAARRQLVGA